MKQEDKQLLLADLCGRLPYGVIIHHKDFFDPKYPRPNETLTVGNLAQYTKDIERWDVKPYLRLMSSMTEKEKEEYCALQDKFIHSSQYPVTDAYEMFDWLNKNMFDYRGLIPMGLALEAKEGMYGKEEK